MPKKHQNDSRSGQKRPQEEPKTTKKAIPNDKTKKGPNQDDLWTVLDRPGADLPTIGALPGCHLGGQNGTKIDPKTIKNRNEKSTRKNNDPRRSWTRLGPILGRPGPPSWATKTPQTIIKRMVSWTIAFSMLRRYEDGLGTNFGRSRRQNDRK